MSSKIFGPAFAKELQAEYTSTKKCLERVPESLYEYKPHPKSMAMGILAQLVAEIPAWLIPTIEKGDIDLATYPHQKSNTTKEMITHFDKSVDKAVALLEKTTDEELEKTFSLKLNGKEMFSSSIMESVAQSINHMVHHRGQLTVYLRLNDIDVPSIYGPSADEKSF